MFTNLRGWTWKARERVRSSIPIESISTDIVNEGTQENYIHEVSGGHSAQAWLEVQWKVRWDMPSIFMNPICPMIMFTLGMTGSYNYPRAGLFYLFHYDNAHPPRVAGASHNQVLYYTSYRDVLALYRFTYKLPHGASECLKKMLNNEISPLHCFNQYPNTAIEESFLIKLLNWESLTRY